MIEETRRTFERLMLVKTGRLAMAPRYVRLLVKRESSSDEVREGEEEPVEVVRSCRKTLGLFGGVSKPGVIDMAKPRPTEIESVETRRERRETSRTSAWTELSTITRRTEDLFLMFSEISRVEKCLTRRTFQAELVEFLSGSVDFFGRKDRFLARRASGRADRRTPLIRLVTGFKIPILPLKSSFVACHDL